ncbi:hypothetical protein DPMN_109715 [Dreissena polymorpha]|uniref:Uncharacterized protein n=1 Tax=Dreissena polymorpha TaxID=45954 RepID=A0A9D4KAS1_DREPO|nr:hypothetical protein DPMN_109715 [Dreissena polymorpha]
MLTVPLQTRLPAARAARVLDPASRRAEHRAPDVRPVRDLLRPQRLQGEEGGRYY